jgi:hypothetical protein
VRRTNRPDVTLLQDLLNQAGLTALIAVVEHERREIDG